MPPLLFWLLCCDGTTSRAEDVETIQECMERNLKLGIFLLAIEGILVKDVLHDICNRDKRTGLFDINGDPVFANGNCGITTAESDRSNEGGKVAQVVSKSSKDLWRMNKKKR